MVNFPAAESHCPLTVTELYCLVTRAQGHEQLAQSRYIATPWRAVEPTTTQSSPAPDPLRHYATQFHPSHQRGSDVQHLTHCATMPPGFTCHTCVEVMSSMWPVAPLCHPACHTSVGVMSST